ncbi:hypothetical protein [Wenjunlia tyrosinilytica]|uniref:Uncharacterized protein n=1 Tax=Wenjunlia tyrosinilytica TaxID=1544741 RepID=A0A917ZDY6_9ACTN|nr:hypothetical protein [Wenjunlia tyrosinilytica]GGO81046.1 hypothetical protein GCM10012280_04390 [Wenjunlia tyrosinilytica]
MTSLQLADAREAADLAAFLARLLHYDKAAAARLQALGSTLAVFVHPPFDVLAVRSAQLADEVLLDTTVSAGQFLEGLDERTGIAPVPPAVTGPPWAGVMPPRGGWQRTAELPLATVQQAVARGISEFRARSEQLGPDRRTRVELDRIAADIWSRPLDTAGAADLPLRAVHAAHALGFLTPIRTPGLPGQRPDDDTAGEGDVAVFASGGWLRVRTPHGSIALRRSTGPGLPVTPVS